MGVIQNAINQMLGTAGIVARLSPEYEKKQELYNLKKEENVIKKQAESAQLKGKDATDPSLMRNIGDIKQREMELAEKRFKLDPTEKSFEESVKKQRSYRAFNEFESTVLQQQDLKSKPMISEGERQVEAMKKVDSIQESKASQKKRVISYPKDLQKTINILKGRDITDDK